MKKVPVALLFVLLASIALVACGSSSSSSSTGSTAEAPTETTESGAAGGEKEAPPAAEPFVKIETAPSGLAFASDTAEAPAGKEVILSFSNAQSVPHDVAIEDSSGEVIGQTEVIAGGETSTRVDLEPGTYTYFCTIPGHREAGMEGTLTVK